MIKKTHKLPFDSRGGVVIMSRFMLNHKNYQTLSPQAKVLMQLMQEQWAVDLNKLSIGVIETDNAMAC